MKKKNNLGESVQPGEKQEHPFTTGGTRSLNSGVIKNLQTRSGRNKLRRILGLPPEKDEYDYIEG